MSQVSASLSRIVHAFQNRLGDAIEKALHTKFSGTEFHVEINKPKQPDVSIGNVFMTPWEIVWFLIPMSIFRPMVTRHFFTLIPREVEKNLHRVRTQWFEAVSISIDKIAREAGLFIHNEISTIENMWAKTIDRQKEIEGAILELDLIKHVKNE
jgi:hypothetical protein